MKDYFLSMEYVKRMKDNLLSIDSDLKEESSEIK